MYQSEGIYFKLISFISIRNFFKQRDKVLKNYPNALVLPMFPKIKNWKLNRYMLKHFLKHADLIISRGIFATNLALLTKNRNSRVIYNGRGAIFSEQNEFGVYNGTGLEETIFQLEKNAVLNSNMRISVSQNLVAYWQKNFKYEKNSDAAIGKWKIANVYSKNKLQLKIKVGPPFVKYNHDGYETNSLKDTFKLLNKIHANIFTETTKTIFHMCDGKVTTYIRTTAKRRTPKF